MEYFNIGLVANAHGIKGFIKVLPTTDDIKRFELLKKIIIEDPKGDETEYKVKQVKYSKKLVLLKLEGINSMDEALLLKRSVIKIPKSKAIPLEEDENYLCDLIGLDVFDEKGKSLGSLVDVIFTGSNDVYVIDNGSKNGILLPALKRWVHEVDIINKKMIVTIPEGLLD
jgi:16S rRNA processing protein RimM